jgi:hypothetical protein
MTTSSNLIAAGLATALVAFAGASSATTITVTEPLTFQEMHAVDDSISAIEFSIMDKNNDGLVDSTEYAAVDLDNLDD